MLVRRALAVLALLAILHDGDRCWAGGGPQNFVVVVNPNDPNSLAVANAYVELRGIPPTNVLYIPWSATQGRTTVEPYRDRLIKPLLAQIKERGLEGQIDGVAFSTGYPYMVDCASLLPASLQASAAQIKPYVSLTSGAYLFHFVLAGGPELFSLNSNGYFASVFEGKTTSRAFSADLKTGQGGAAGSKPGGLPYLLAMSLGVTHGRGNKPEEIIASLRRAKEADGKKYRGTIYYMKNSDVRSTTRDAGYPDAIKELTELGVKAELLPGVTPNEKTDVAGMTTGKADVNLRGSGSTLLPGAIVDNLTSAAGQFLVRPDAPHPQTPVSEFIRLGAGGAAGAVVEPMAIAAKFPSPHIHVHYARGCSLAEAFYQSVAGPYQLIIVGDPLCQPWAVPPKVSVDGATEGAVLKSTVRIKPTATYSDSRAAARFELFVDGVRRDTISPGGSFSFGAAGIADGYHELRVVAIDNTPVGVQGAWIGLVQVKNGVDAIQMSAAAKRIKLGETLSVEAKSTRKADAEVFHNGRRLGVITGGSGKLTVDTTKLGKGKVQLWAQQSGKPALRSRPLAIEVN
jgi:hypothetical protein